MPTRAAKEDDDAEDDDDDDDDPWENAKVTGHPWLGLRARVFSGSNGEKEVEYDEPVDGTSSSGCRQTATTRLWRMRDDDGDYQDFDEEEAEMALRAFDEKKARRRAAASAAAGRGGGG